MWNFGDRLHSEIMKKKSVVCAGIDPRFGQMPEVFRQQPTPTLACPESVQQCWTTGDFAEALCDLYKYYESTVGSFCRMVIDSVADVAVCVKPQFAFFEQLGPAGSALLSQVISYARHRGLLVIADAKRNDIGSTAQAYAKAIVSDFEYKCMGFESDAVTVNPYLGTDGLKPFMDEGAALGKGMFALVKTSNPSSGELQDRTLDSGEPVYEAVAELIRGVGDNYIGESGLSAVGAVVGATYPEQGAKLRELMPNTPFLIPGYGAQGATVEDLKAFFPDGRPAAVVNSSRGIIFAHGKDAYAGLEPSEAVAKAARDMRDELSELVSF